eukprot:TRINITY_DN1183_c0_g1_i3.p1 TRINITY_DN1183_c0_g1~~TRINITY_DN1183_c0_g1_i3.p1  ORF type:complete len:759 (+),score=95.76 TRINITY_DN1183_c0_g1_i3:220-2277(+)
MPGKRKYFSIPPEQWSESQQKRADRDAWYRSAHSQAGQKFVEVPATIAPEVRAFAKSKTAHIARNAQLGESFHHARQATWAAHRNGLISKSAALEEATLHKLANIAKHHDRSFCHNATRGLRETRLSLSSIAPDAWDDPVDPADDASFTAPPTNNESGCRNGVSRTLLPCASAKEAWADISDTASSSMFSPVQDVVRSPLTLETASIKTPRSVSPLPTACYQRNPALHFGSLPDNWEELESAAFTVGPPSGSGEEEKPTKAGLAQAVVPDTSDLQRQLQVAKGLAEALLTRNAELLSQVNYLQSELLWNRSYLDLTGQLEESSTLAPKVDINEVPLHECKDAYTGLEPKPRSNADSTWLIGDLAQRISVLESQNSAQASAVASLVQLLASQSVALKDIGSMLVAKCEYVKRALIEEIEPLLRNIKGYIREELNRTQARLAPSLKQENHDKGYVDEVQSDQTPCPIVSTSEGLLPEIVPDIVPDVPETIELDTLPLHPSDVITASGSYSTLTPSITASKSSWLEFWNRFVHHPWPFPEVIHPFDEEQDLEPKSWRALRNQPVDHYSVVHDNQQPPAQPWHSDSQDSNFFTTASKGKHHGNLDTDTNFGGHWQQMPRELQEAFCLMEAAKFSGEDVAQQVIELANAALTQCSQDVRQQFAIAYDQFRYYQLHRKDCPHGDSSKETYC